MKRLVVDAMKDGVFGLASALIYPKGPISFVATEDLIALARARWLRTAVSTSLICAPRPTVLLEGIDEAIRDRTSEVAVEIIPSQRLPASGIGTKRMPPSPGLPSSEPGPRREPRICTRTTPQARGG